MILARCLTTIKTAAANPNKINSVGKSKIQANNGVKTAATIEPSETYRVAKTITSHVKKTIAVTFGIKNVMTPSPVATPLPPRNFIKTDKECPITAKIPAKAMAVNCNGGSVQISATNTAKKPRQFFSLARLLFLLNARLSIFVEDESFQILFSLPLISRMILARCLTTIKIAAANPNNVNCAGMSKIQANIGVKTAATIDPNET